VEQGYLAKANFRSLFYEGGVTLSDNDIRQIQEQLELPKSVLEKLADDEKRNLRILLEVETLAKQHSRIIVFAISVEHSDQLAAVLQTRGLKANSITSKTPPSERRRLLDEYKSASEGCTVLFNFGVLTTGFDAPRTSAAIIARPTQSLVLYSQMVGRAIRGPKAGGNETAEIVTVIDNGLPGFRDIAEAFHNWEDIWRVER
jgi:superfamily II DNA or RNA helicase